MYYLNSVNHETATAMPTFKITAFDIKTSFFL